MSKSLTYVEIDVPDPRCVVHLAFDLTQSREIIDTNAAGTERVWTSFGDVVIDTTAPFGTGNLFLDGDSAIATPDTPDLNLDSNDFSIEFWFFKDVAIGTERNVCGQRLGVGGANTTRAFNIDFDTSGHLRGLVFQGSTQIACTSTATFGVSSTFHHVSFTRLGSTLTLYIDGAVAATNTITGAINDSSGSLSVGQDGDDDTADFLGWIDEFTICMYARRTAAFTPDPTFWNDFTPRLGEPSRTLRFALDTGYLPANIDAIPNIIDVKIDPATVSLGVDIGQRATVTVRFRDHKHIFSTEAYSSGTFWGKFRAFYGVRLTSYPLRLITGTLGQTLAGMETRHFILESTDGPSPQGEFKIIAKDVLKFADGDRAQAPILSNGFLTANISSGATTFTLSPAGIGNQEYPASGSVAIGGSEICTFTRAGDVMTITRAQFNTTAVAHNAQDRAQLVLIYTGAFVTEIIFDLLVRYADVPRAYIDFTSWETEVDDFLSTVYTAQIAEPTSVSTLISELIEQVGLAMWWDDIAQLIKLVVLRPIASTAAVFSGDNYLANSLKVTEQPEKRISEVYTYFAKVNPLKAEDQEDNYRSTAFTVDDESEAAYGTAAIKKIFSRWIPAGGRSIALSLNAVQLARFSDPPRRISFDLLRGSVATPAIGVGYQIEGWPFQNRNGTAAMIPAQITRLTAAADVFSVEFEEIFSATAQAVGSPGVHVVTIDASIQNVNLRSMHDSLYGTPVSGNEVRCTVNAGVIIGSATTGTAAFEVGTWPAGVSVLLTIYGRIQGHGGQGGFGSGSVSSAGTVGETGGTAILTRKAITLIDAAGAIWGGGGGGGGGGSAGNSGGQPLIGGSGGGGGAGVDPGAGGLAGGGINLGINGSIGAPQAGGAGGGPGPAGSGGRGGDGGAPGLAGATGGTPSAPVHTIGGAGGGAGIAIDGISFVTTSGGAGDRRGGQVN